MKEPVDKGARLRALTDFESTLLVEAAAGTGKTALMAGRLTLLLAHGVAPRSLAAITFTELAASEIGARVHRYVRELLDGVIPRSLRLALPDGVSERQHAALSAAATRLDELTTTTIHSFCQTIICSYAVEADIDPGAGMLDAQQADAAFDSVFDRWFRRRLNGPGRPDDAIEALSRYDPHHVAGTLRSLARFRLKHRGAAAPIADLSGRPDIDLVDAVANFRRWLAGQPAEPKTNELVGQLETLAGHFAQSFATPPGFELLWRLAHPERLACMRSNSVELLPLRTKTAWVKAVGKERAGVLYDEAARYFDRVDHCYRIIVGRIATALVRKLSDELDEVLAEYATFKRAAAVLDFDDLLERACALVRNHDTVRRALGVRYRHILVDEFQDTDRIQAEILFRIAADESPPQWPECVLHEGALFMVGDPKQSIYRFRGADVGSYSQARTAIVRRWPRNLIQITANFRSRPAILTHVNSCFARPLSRNGQPGYVELAPTLDPPVHDLPCVAKLIVDPPPGARAPEIREAEAEAVADLCARLIGNVKIRDEDDRLAPLTPGGIVLLAPTGTQLAFYERALEARGLPIASLAGKGLFRRQEVQDLIALARVMADPSDRLAFGALMRGPLVGLTEEELLDITAGLPPPARQPDEIARFSVMTEADQVPHARARRVLAVLQDLRRRSRKTTPALLLAEAIERLQLWPILSARDSGRSARAAANVEAVLDRARPYGVRGLKQFVRDISRDWRLGVDSNEGRVDVDGDAIALLTIHSAKGLEWPVVIPINTGTQIRTREPFVHQSEHDTLHWIIGDVVPPELRAALETDAELAARERERLWYVVCTRACELLILPEVVQAEQNSWARAVDLGHAALPVLDVSRMVVAPAAVGAEPENQQSAEVFAAEAVKIQASSVTLSWLRPSQHDPDRMQVLAAIDATGTDAPEAEAPVGAGRVRGLLLHKLMEEVLTGEVAEDVESLSQRARDLLEQLIVEPVDSGERPAAGEIAATVRRTLELPELAKLRGHLMAEWPVYGLVSEVTTPTALAGRIDAVAYEGTAVDVVVDWKSDVDPSKADILHHKGQLEDYVRTVGARRGALVYMTPGMVLWTLESRGPER